MKTITNSEQVLLGLIAEKPRHGYELEQIIRERGIRQWTELGFSSIYYLISKLENKRLLASRVSGARKTYFITDEGVRATVAAARHSLVDMAAPHSPVLVGLANSSLLKRSEVIDLLQRRKEKIKQQIQAITEAKKAPVPDFAEAIFDYSFGQLAAEAKWCDRTIKSLEGGAMEKTDFKKTMPALYGPKNKEWEALTVPPLRFLIDGQGNPNTAQSYTDAVEALYGVSYALKFMSKKTLGKDYVVMPLEGLWYSDDYSIFEKMQKDKYKWTMMIMQPEWITENMVKEAIVATQAKRQASALSKLRFEQYDEGRAVQLLHIGSYDDEAPKLKDLHDEYLPAHGLTFNGHHHEIYLGDPRRTVPEKLKTILRQPVREV